MDNKLELILNQLIKDQVELKLETVEQNQLLSPELKRTKLEQEIRGELEQNDSRELLANAVRILLSEGDVQLQENIRKISQNLDELKELNAEAMQSALIIPNEFGLSILKIAKDKYLQGLLDESLAVFHFLTVVNPYEADYWIRLGLIAQKCEKYPLALEALERAKDLAPEFCETYIFAAFCYLKMGLKDGALTELTAARKLDKCSEKLNDIEGLYESFRVN